MSFLRPPHVRDFVKKGFFCVPRYEVWGGGGGGGVKNPLTIHEIYAALTLSGTRSDVGSRAWASESAAAKQAEDYSILSSNTCSRSFNVSVLIKEGF